MTCCGSAKGALCPITPEEVTVKELPEAFVKALTQLDGALPEGSRFLKGTYGITHFLLSEPPSHTPGLLGLFHGKETGQFKVVVFSHGIGGRLHEWDGPINNSIVAAGFRTLRYSFLGCGWSFTNRGAPFDKHMFLTQVGELLDHVLGPAHPVDLWVGHSTGCVVGIHAAAAGATGATVQTHPIHKVAFVSPAIWAQKPWIARVLDTFPNVVTFLTTALGIRRKLVGQAYLENNDNAFGHEDSGGVKAYFHKEAHDQLADYIRRMFQLHPQIDVSVLGTNTHYLRLDLLAVWREECKELFQKQPLRILLLWGDHDIVVRVENATEAAAWAPDKTTLVKLARCGHESVTEDPQAIATEIVKFLHAEP